MKRLCQVFFSLCIFYLLLSSILSMISKGHNINYVILRKQDEIEISEKFVRRTKNEENSYSLKLTVADDNFDYHLLHTFNKRKKIVKDVHYQKDGEYSCMLPIFIDNQILTDIICKNKNDIYYNYSTIKEPSLKLQEFAQAMNKYGYKKRQYQDQTNVKRKVDLLELYTNNIPENLLFGITNYKGLYLLKDKQLSNVLLFDQDIYTREISTFVDNYYVVADYDDVYDLKTFYLINLKDGSKEKILSNDAIASDSYITGIVDDTIYIVDKSNKKQYGLSVSNKKIVEIGNEIDNMKYYDQDNWLTVPYSRMTLKNTYFDTFKENKDGDYTLFSKTNGQYTGYSYYYKIVDGKYEIYRSQNKDEKNKMYLFTTDNIDTIKCSKHYIFYQIKNEIKYYSDMTGIRTLLSNSELEFNKDIMYGIYEK